MKGSDIEKYLTSLSHAEEHARDNNDYLISFRLDTGVEVAFDPRTTTKASLFVSALPERLLNTSTVELVDTYPPTNPSTALSRVSKQLSEADKKYRLEIKDNVALSRLVEWVRWA